MAKDVNEMTREELVEALIEQSRHLRTLETQRNHFRALSDSLHKETLELGHLVMQMRSLGHQLVKLGEANGKDNTL